MKHSLSLIILIVLASVSACRNPHYSYSTHSTSGPTDNSKVHLSKNFANRTNAAGTSQSADTTGLIVDNVTGRILDEAGNIIGTITDGFATAGGDFISAGTDLFNSIIKAASASGSGPNKEVYVYKHEPPQNKESDKSRTKPSSLFFQRPKNRYSLSLTCPGIMALRGANQDTLDQATRDYINSPEVSASCPTDQPSASH